MTGPGIVSIKQMVVTSVTSSPIQVYTVSCLDNYIPNRSASCQFSIVYIHLPKYHPHQVILHLRCGLWFPLTKGSSPKCPVCPHQNHRLYSLTPSTLHPYLCSRPWHICATDLKFIIITPCMIVFSPFEQALSPQLHMNFLERNYHALFFCKNFPIGSICRVPLTHRVSEKLFLTVIRL